VYFLLTSPASVEQNSQIRQVPDTQEVFVVSDSDASFVLEILQRVAANDPKEAVQFSAQRYTIPCINPLQILVRFFGTR
jgi:hypothetical protein